MRVAVVPASTRSTTAAIRAILLQDSAGSTSVQIKAWYRDPRKAPTEFTSKPNFEAVTGDIADESSLDFQGCDAVLYVPPPFIAKPDMIAMTERLSLNVRNAIERASSVKRVVLMSSQGAHLYDGVGEIKTKIVAERVIRAAKVPRITIIRPAYFMENWAQHFPSINSPEPSMVSIITPLDWKLPMVSLGDVGEALAKEATTDVAQPFPVHTYELLGPQKEGYSPNQAHEILLRLFDKDIALKEVELSALPGFLSKTSPPGALEEMVEMVKGFSSGGFLVEKPDPEANVVLGRTSLEDALKKAVEAAGIPA